MKYVLYFLIIMSLSGCVQRKEVPLVITTNLWVGFTPIIYAQQTGMLKNCNIKLHIVSSLGESYRLYDSGLISGFTGTQAEASRTKDKDLYPVVLFDISYGADSVVGTMPPDTLRTMEGKEVTVYYEMNTVNEILLKYMYEHGFLSDDRQKVLLRNMNQDQMTNMDLQGTDSIVITYDPYTSKYIKDGLHLIVSSEHDDILILDALFVKKDVIEKYVKDIRILRDSSRKALKVLNENPAEFYRVIKDYLKDQGYNDFVNSIKGIKWIMEERKDGRVIQMMKHNNIPTSELILD